MQIRGKYITWPCDRLRYSNSMRYLVLLAAASLAALPVFAQPTPGQTQQSPAQPFIPIPNQQLTGPAEPSITQQLRTLRGLPDSKRGAVTKRLALEIREAPIASRLGLAQELANLATEGDFGRDTLQEVATTLAGALRETHANDQASGMAYSELAQLVRYEHVDASLDTPEFRAAMAQLETDDQRRQDAGFTLSDLQGNSWTLKNLRGKVVLVNFWATWCPPCRKEMPDLDALYQRFKDQGLVILAISDEPADKVAPFIAEHPYTYPILLDPGQKVHQEFVVQGIPKSFIYDREGRLAAQAIDMRTMNQFLTLLDRAGIH
jgi:peroxiredoxin